MQAFETEDFDLDKALDGQEVITMNGHSVRIVDTTRKADDGRNIVGLIKYDSGEKLRSFASDGTCGADALCLQLKVVYTGGWFNIYEGRKVDPTIYGTKTQAEKAATVGCIAQTHAKWLNK